MLQLPNLDMNSSHLFTFDNNTGAWQIAFLIVHRFYLFQSACARVVWSCYCGRYYNIPGKNYAGEVVKWHQSSQCVGDRENKVNMQKRKMHMSTNLTSMKTAFQYNQVGYTRSIILQPRYGRWHECNIVLRFSVQRISFTHGPCPCTNKSNQYND